MAEEQRHIGAKPTKEQYAELAIKKPRYTNEQSVEVKMRDDDFSAAQKQSLGMHNLTNGDPDAAEKQGMPEVVFNAEIARDTISSQQRRIDHLEEANTAL